MVENAGEFGNYCQINSCLITKLWLCGLLFSYSNAIFSLKNRSLHIEFFYCFVSFNWWNDSKRHSSNLWKPILLGAIKIVTTEAQKRAIKKWVATRRDQYNAYLRKWSSENPLEKLALIETAFEFV